MSTLKRTARTVLRPFARPFLRPIIRRIDEVNDLAVRLDRHLPLIENAIESQNSELRSRAREDAGTRAELQRLKDELAQAQQQIEALRRDVAMTLAAGAHAAAGPAQPVAEQRGMQQFGDGSGELRLSFGCGPQNAPDHVKVDLRELRGGNLVVGLRSLPFRECTATELRASLCLECFSVAELRRVVLPYWHSLLVPGGVFVAVSIDAAANLTAYQAGLLSFEDLATLSFGADVGSATPRRSMLSEDLLRRLLEEVGFLSIETVARRRGKDAVNQIEVRAKRADAAAPPVEVVSRTSARSG